MPVSPKDRPKMAVPSRSSLVLIRACCRAITTLIMTSGTSSRARIITGAGMFS